MIHHWKINNPDYRELQCKKRFEMVQKAWDEQKAEKDQKEAAEKRHEEIRIRVEAEKALRQEEVERKEQRDREQKIGNSVFHLHAYLVYKPRSKSGTSRLF